MAAKFSLQLQLLNCITGPGPAPALEDSSATQRHYIDLQSNIIGHQLNYYRSGKVREISYLYFGEMNAAWRKGWVIEAHLAFRLLQRQSDILFRFQDPYTADNGK